MIIPLGMLMKDGHSLGVPKRGWSLPWIWLLESKMSNVAKFMEAEFFPNVSYLGFCMIVRLMLS
jgi:hypothetical protein